MWPSFCEKKPHGSNLDVWNPKNFENFVPPLNHCFFLDFSHQMNPLHIHFNLPSPWGCQMPHASHACFAWSKYRTSQLCSFLLFLKLTWGDWLHSTGDPKHKYPEFQVSLKLHMISLTFIITLSRRLARDPPKGLNWKKHADEPYLNHPNYNDRAKLHCAPTLGRFQAG